MNNSQNTPFVFYLSLDEQIPQNFWVFDRLFKEQGYILLPVKIDQLQAISSAAEQNHIVVLASTDFIKDMVYYEERVRKLLPYILKSKRITFLHLSSYSKLDDTKKFAMSRNYFFIKLPLDARILVKTVTRFFEKKQTENSKWPGGKRAGLAGIRSE